MAGISIGWVLAPLIIAFIAYEINTLPRKMAEKISTAVVEELSGKFTVLIIMFQLLLLPNYVRRLLLHIFQTLQMTHL